MFYKEINKDIQECSNLYYQTVEINNRQKENRYIREVCKIKHLIILRMSNILVIIIGYLDT